MKFEGNKRQYQILIAAAATAVATTLLGGKPMPIEPSVVLKKAARIYARGNFGRAEELLRELASFKELSADDLKTVGSYALWGNDPRRALQYYRRSLARNSFFGRIWPLNADLKYRMALTCYRMDDFRCAARYYHEAAGPIAIGPFAELEKLGKFMALFKKDKPYR